MTHYHILFRVSIYEGKTFFFLRERKRWDGGGVEGERIFFKT